MAPCPLGFFLNLGFLTRYDGITDTQSLIRRTLFPEAGRRTLAALPASGTVPGRMAFVCEVCTTFGFRDPLGHLQDAGCLSVLRDLTHVGALALPSAKPGAGVDCAVRGLAAAVPTPVGVPNHVDPVEVLVVTLAETDTARQRFGTILDAEHPLGAGLHFGLQTGHFSSRPALIRSSSGKNWSSRTGCVIES